MLYVTTLYCGPRVRTGKERGSHGGGVYPELGPLGGHPGLGQYGGASVGVDALLCTCSSGDATSRCGDGWQDSPPHHAEVGQRSTDHAAARPDGLAGGAMSSGPVGDELAGKCVGVAIDGGRTRLRENRCRCRRKGQRITRRRKYDAKWREPNVLIIFELDECGRMKRGSRAWIDATFQGPDHLMELTAFHLHRLGALRAQTVAFVSDGAPRIWERLAWV